MDLGILKGPLLLFGGPYSNLEATLAMHREADRLGLAPEQVICNGDLVAYCAQPEETIRAVREWGIHVLAGNCETALAQRSGDCGCGFEEGSACALLSDNWYPYTDASVSSESRHWMGELPLAIRFKLGHQEFQVVHGAPGSINRFVFASTPKPEKQVELDNAGTDIIIGGHCGIPFGQPQKRGYWLNTGVIGMPANDGTPDGWYLLIEPGPTATRASWHRLEYDNRKSNRAMTDAELANGYADALLSGLWPSMDILPDQERALRGTPIAISPLALD